MHKKKKKNHVDVFSIHALTCRILNLECKKKGVGMGGGGGIGGGMVELTNRQLIGPIFYKEIRERPQILLSGATFYLCGKMTWPSHILDDVKECSDLRWVVEWDKSSCHHLDKHTSHNALDCVNIGLSLPHQNYVYGTTTVRTCLHLMCFRSHTVYNLYNINRQSGCACTGCIL